MCVHVCMCAHAILLISLGSHKGHEMHPCGLTAWKNPPAKADLAIYSQMLGVLIMHECNFYVEAKMDFSICDVIQSHMYHPRNIELL